MSWVEMPAHCVYWREVAQPAAAQTCAWAGWGAGSAVRASSRAGEALHTLQSIGIWLLRVQQRTDDMMTAIGGMHVHHTHAYNYPPDRLPAH